MLRILAFLFLAVAPLAAEEQAAAATAAKAEIGPNSPEVAAYWKARADFERSGVAMGKRPSRGWTPEEIKADPEMSLHMHNLEAMHAARIAFCVAFFADPAKRIQPGKSMETDRMFNLSIARYPWNGPGDRDAGAMGAALAYAEANRVQWLYEICDHKGDKLPPLVKAPAPSKR